MRHWPLLALALLLVLPRAASSDVVMTEISGQSFFDVAGMPIEIIHCSRGLYLTPELEKPDNFAPGVAWADINNDGWLDLLMGNGSMSNHGDEAAGNYMLMNNGDGTFTDVSDEMGFYTSRVANGLAIADADNDGQVDLAVGNFMSEPYFFYGRPSYMNERAEHIGLNPLFYDVYNPPPVYLEPESMGMLFGDYNQDGFVDLYVSNHRDQPDVMFRSLGGGYFDRTELVEVTAEGWGFQGSFWDFDNDGDQDIYVVNDFGYNFLFENQGPEGDFDFEELAVVYRCAGAAHTEHRSMGMGIAIGDYDQDLDEDIYVTNYFENILYSNEGIGEHGVWQFRDVAPQKGVDFNLNCWGVDFCDIDNDGDLDLIQASGFIHGKPGVKQDFEIPNKLWLNNGPPDFDFTDISDAAGFNHLDRGRGLATGDFDRDGDVDALVGNTTYFYIDGAPGVGPGAEVFEGRLLLYRNDQDEGNHWVKLKLEGLGSHGDGTGCNRSALGARLYLTAGGTVQMRDVRSGNSFLSQSSLELDMGVGAATIIDEVKVRWLCGLEEIFDGVEVDRGYRLIEGEGTARPLPVAISSFVATPMTDGIRLAWVVGPGVEPNRVDVIRFRVEHGQHLDRRELGLAPARQEAGWIAFDGEVIPGQRYAYQLVIWGEDGIEVQSPIVEATAQSGSTPAARPILSQNFPNPFNPTTSILYVLPRSMTVTLTIHDLQGRVVRTLHRGEGRPGENRHEWDGLDDGGLRVASGVYTYMLQTPEGSSARRMVLVK